MASLKKMFSWFGPVKVAEEKGAISPVLEVAFENGVMVLNAGRVNYSFGALHKVFQIAFRKARLQKREPQSALILGFGVGSIASIIRDEYNWKCPIVGVEADAQVIRLGKLHFGVQEIPSLELIHDRAENYIRKNERKFDLIAVDLFVEELVPEECRTEEFLNGLKRALSKNGILLFNEMPQHGLPGEDELENRFRKIFPGVEIHSVRAGEEPNRIYVVRNQD